MEGHVVSLPPRVQTLVDQIVQELNLQALRPSALEINMDGDGVVQDVKPKIIYRRRKDDIQKELDRPPK